MEKSTSIMLTGAPATGKSTLARELVQVLPLELMPAHTTRPPRENEINGRDYIFLEKPSFKARFQNGEYLEPSLWYAWYEGYYYGSPKLWIARATESSTPILFISNNVETARIVKDNAKDKVAWIHLTANEESRSDRLKFRGSKQDEIRGRLERGDTHGINRIADTNIDTSEIDLTETIRLVTKFVYQR